MASHLVSLILVSAWFAWCLVWDVGTLSNTLIKWVCHSGPQGGPSEACAVHPTHLLRLVVRPSVVHVGN